MSQVECLALSANESCYCTHNIAVPKLVVAFQPLEPVVTNLDYCHQRSHQAVVFHLLHKSGLAALVLLGRPVGDSLRGARYSVLPIPAGFELVAKLVQQPQARLASPAAFLPHSSRVTARITARTWVESVRWRWRACSQPCC